MNILLLGFLTGLDNLQISPALGLIRFTRSQRLKLAVMFGLAESIMPLVGFVLGHAFHFTVGAGSENIGSWCVLACGLVVTLSAAGVIDLKPVLNSKYTCVLLPLALSLDNLLAGFGVGVRGAALVETAWVIGGISALMSFAGLTLGSTIRRWRAVNSEWLSATYLVLLGVAGIAFGTQG
jgi:putative Mn2+ efflux pump MntP